MKRYTDGDDDDESDEEQTKRRTARNIKEEAPMASLDGTGTLAGSLDAPFAGSLAATAGDVGEDETTFRWSACALYTKDFTKRRCCISCVL